MSKSSRDLVRISEAIAKNCGVKFCTQCRQTRPVDGGTVRALSNGRSRWECAPCTTKRTKGAGK